jgi:1-deoxyxylulose-5-phosphate synthase
MDYVKLGSTGLDVSPICLGMMSFGEPGRGGHAWSLDEEASRPLIRRAIDAGINFFDTANVYSAGSSEEITGRALKEFTRRDEIVLATKVHGRMAPGPNGAGLSRKAILAGIDASLARLGTDYVDLYQIHRFDQAVPIEETMEALHDVVKSGKARYIGASSMFAWQFAKAQHVAQSNGWTRFVSMQNHYNLLYREEEREMIPLCRDQGVALLPYSPLARGLLAGTRQRPDTARTSRSANDPLADSQYDQTEIVDVVVDIAQERGVPAAQVALAWLLRQPGVCAPIVGATKVAHLTDAIAALDIELTSEEASRLESPYRPSAVLS